MEMEKIRFVMGIYLKSWQTAGLLSKETGLLFRIFKA